MPETFAKGRGTLKMKKDAHWNFGGKLTIEKSTPITAIWIDKIMFPATRDQWQIVSINF
jgi:hypothetical protein